MFPAYAFCAGRWGQTFNELEALNGGLFEYIYICVCVCFSDKLCCSHRTKLQESVNGNVAETC